MVETEKEGSGWRGIQRIVTTDDDLDMDSFAKSAAFMYCYVSVMRSESDTRVIFRNVEVHW